MKDLTENNFGLLIAFLLPGFISLWGLSYSSPEVAIWLAKSSIKDAPTVGGFLYSTLASLALGLLISAIRWLVVDHFLKWTGVRDPGLNFTKLKDKDIAAAFKAVIENHYRYYQYYSNSLIAVIAAFVVYFSNAEHLRVREAWIVSVSLILVLYLGSRDALKKYFARAAQILS